MKPKRFELRDNDLARVRAARNAYGASTDAQALRIILTRAASVGLLDAELPGTQDVVAAQEALRRHDKGPEAYALQMAWTVITRAAQRDRPQDVDRLAELALQILDQPDTQETDP